MGDFNARHNFWEPVLPRSRRNRSGMSPSGFLADSDSLSLLTLAGLPTRIDLVSENPSTLELCLGNCPPLLTTITTGPYVGSDHLPVLIAFPAVPPPPHTSRRPHWSFKKGRPGIFSNRIRFSCPTHNPPMK
ncbi:hypothetical protein E2C01_045026 [Portunus trituberculatus]|uniref:Endonuclease/exonuclease/phosphatase domain-containing protein n=1 Tax=Portunus trituberculatus TaxID=210409 RepID=A0A5B7G0X7_PORTR|nr:hypothetical protein [Portunus trituberculatus]